MVIVISNLLKFCAICKFRFKKEDNDEKNDGVLTLKNTKFYTIFLKSKASKYMPYHRYIYQQHVTQENITFHVVIIDYRRQPPFS